MVCVTMDLSELVESFSFLPDNINVRFGLSIYIHIIIITMGTNCTPLVLNTILFINERDFMLIFLNSKIQRNQT